MQTLVEADSLQFCTQTYPVELMVLLKKSKFSRATTENLFLLHQKTKKMHVNIKYPKLLKMLQEDVESVVQGNLGSVS